MEKQQSRKFVPQLNKKTTIAIRKKDGNNANIVPDFMFNIETWSFQTVRSKAINTFEKLSDIIGPDSGISTTVRFVGGQALPAIPAKTALEVYTCVLRTLMVPLIDNREIAERILADDASLVRDAFGVTDTEHQACIAEAVKYLDKISLVHFLEKQRANNSKVSADDFTSEEQHKTWLQESDGDIDSRIAKIKTEPPQQIRLIVDVLDAKELAIRDTVAKSSDPFVVLKSKTIGERKSKDKEKTKVIQKNLNPVWNEKFTFPLRAENSRIKFEVWDSDMASPPDFIGHRTLLVNSLTPFFPQTHVFQLAPRSGGILKKGKVDEKLGSLRVKTQYLFRKLPERCTGPEVLKTFEEANDMFKILVRMFITEHSAEITQDIAWVFNNFCAIYGIGRIQQRLTMLEILIANFLPKQANITSVKTIANECSKDIFGQRCTPKKSEVECYYGVMDVLRLTLENLISKYTFAFPVNSSRIYDNMTLKGAISLFEFAWDVCLDNNLRAKKGTFRDVLITLVEKTMEQNWEIWKNSEMSNLAIQDGDGASSTVVSAVTMQMLDDDSMTLTLLYLLCEHVCIQLANDVDVYTKEFPSDINLAQRSISFYYDKLSGYVSDVFVTKPTQVSLSTFTIYGKLMELHRRFEPLLAHVKLLNLQQVFRKYFDQWVAQASHKLKNWAKSAIENETWEPIASTDGSLHTSSVVDIFTSFAQSRQFLVLLGPDLKSQYVPFTKVVGTVSEYYGNKLKEFALQEIAVELEQTKFEKEFAQFLVQNQKGIAKQLHDRLHHHHSSHLKAISLTASPKLCAVLNSLEVSRELLDEFVSDMEKIAKDDGPNISTALKPTFTTLKTICDQVDDVILTKMNRCINIIMGQILQTPPTNVDSASDDEIDEQLAFLFWYLDQELEILSSNLYEHVFLRLLRQIYVMLLRDIEDIVFPEGAVDSYKQEEQALFIEAVLKTHINPFFSADGQGLTEAFITKHSQHFLQALALFRADTTKLTSLYSSLPKNSLIYESVSAHHVLSVLASRRTDKKAQEFVDKKMIRSKSRTFKLKFNVTNQIDYIASFSCLQQSPVFSFVQFFITNSVVSWSASLSNYREVVPLTNIFSVKMIDDDLGLSFVSNNPPQSYYFRGFARQEKLEQAFNTLVLQAKKAGNTKCTEEVDSQTLAKLKSQNARAVHHPNSGKLPRKSNNSENDKLNNLLLNNAHHPAVLKIQKEQKYRLRFGLPDDEPITHSYMCSFHVASVGKMTIAQHYVCFRSKFPACKLTIPISEIHVLEKKRTAMFNDAISIKTSAKTYFFSSFQKRDEVFLILSDLWDAVHHDDKKKP